MAYHVRRSLKAIPAHLGEQVPWEQIVIDRVYGSRRSKNVYVVWSCVDPTYRHQIEPIVNKLGGWTRKLILRRIEERPNIPFVQWVYNPGHIPDAIPRRLLLEMKNIHEEAEEPMERRVELLKRKDSVAERMKGIPWFMPYLWAKDKRAAEEQKIRNDNIDKEVEKLEKIPGVIRPRYNR